MALQKYSSVLRVLPLFGNCPDLLPGHMNCSVRDTSYYSCWACSGLWLPTSSRCPGLEPPCVGKGKAQLLWFKSD